jgi:hypothetical protein
MVLNTSFNENEPMVCTRLAGPVRWRLRAEPIRDSTDALVVQVYYSVFSVWAGYGECAT